MLTVGVLKSKVELVLRVEHFKTRVTAPRTLETTTFTIDINTYILGKLLCILQPSIPKIELKAMQLNALYLNVCMYLDGMDEIWTG